MSVCCLNLIWKYYIRHVVIIMTCGFPASAASLHCHSKSSPVATWDGKVSIILTLQYLAGNSRPSGYFLPTFFLSQCFSPTV